MPEISVVVCTYNRCQSLRDTLRALKIQSLPAGVSMEIIVVDNNSSDRTREVIEEEFKGCRWATRYLFESNQGKSFALNRGIQEASGDLLAFTDDDAIPDPDWLEALVKASERFHADAVGGRIFPLWSADPPDWFRDPQRQLALFGVLDRGDQPILAGENHDGNFLFGANVAYRRSVFEEAGFFRTDLGPKGYGLGRGEDSEMIKRLMRLGKRILYVPDAVVRHKVPKERMSLRYLRSWKYQAGQSFARVSKKSQGVPGWLVRECLESGLSALWNYLRGSPLRAIDAEEVFWSRLGMIRELGRRS